MTAPDAFVKHLTEMGYHPRSAKHGNALCLAILGDLLRNCDRIAELAAAVRLVYTTNHTIRVGRSDWNIDLVLGPPPAGFRPIEASLPIHHETPSIVRIAVEAKTIMTEHGKAAGTGSATSTNSRNSSTVTTRTRSLRQPP